MFINFNIQSLLKGFANDETGAISVDWVVITAMVVGLGLAVAILVTDGIRSTTIVINDTIDSAPSAVPPIVDPDDNQTPGS